MDPFEDKKIPDFFSARAQMRSDADSETDELENDEVKFDLNVTDTEDPMDEVPYDFRAEYKERIDRTFSEDEETDKNFSSIRMHAIGIGLLIGILVALLFSVFLFGSKEDVLDEPIVVNESTRPVKVRPTNPGGMDIPDQDKTIYKKMRSGEVDTKVERLIAVDEVPVRPQVPTKEGRILGTPKEMPKTSEEMELEVLSVRKNAVLPPVSKASLVKTVSVKPDNVQAKTDDVEIEQKPVVEQKTEDVQKTEGKKENIADVKQAVLDGKQTVPAVKKNTVASDKKAEPAAAKKTTETWYVQLISLPSKSAVEKAWPKLLKAHSALLSGLSHDVAEVKIKEKGTFYRLRVGTFKNRKEAQTLCDKLKSRKQDCMVAK